MSTSINEEQPFNSTGSNNSSANLPSMSKDKYMTTYENFLQWKKCCGPGVECILLDKAADIQTTPRIVFMNLVYENPCVPLRVLIVSPISETGYMLSIKAMRGVLFGLFQMVELTLLVYANELDQANQLKYELDSAGFPCNNGVIVTSTLPSISDADVFIFITEFPSLNSLDFNKLDDDATFDSLYLILKIANNLEMPPPPEKPEIEPLTNIKKKKKPEEKPRKPIIIADGLVALDILKTFSKNLPNDIFFCPTPLSGVARTVLAEKLGVLTYQLNHVFVWAANDKIFHVDVGVPLYTPEKSQEREHCEWDALANKEYEDFEMEPMQFNAAWLKKDYIQKLATLCGNNEAGNLYKAEKLCRTLRNVWKTRSLNPLPSYHSNLGIISDGTLETHKGLPYFLPITFSGETYKVNEHLKDDYHLKQEIKRINEAVLEHHRKLIPYCKKFLKKNVIKVEFLPKSDESSNQGFTLSSVTSKNENAV